MRQRKEKTRKCLDSYPEWVERIQQERFNNEVECLELQVIIIFLFHEFYEISQIKGTIWGKKKYLQKLFQNILKIYLIQAEIDAKEKIYKQEFEKNFETGEKLTNKIHDAKSKLYEVEILNSGTFFKYVWPFLDW